MNVSSRSYTNARLEDRMRYDLAAPQRTYPFLSASGELPEHVEERRRKVWAEQHSGALAITIIVATAIVSMAVYAALNWARLAAAFKPHWPF